MLSCSFCNESLNCSVGLVRLSVSFRCQNLSYYQYILLPLIALANVASYLNM